MFSGSETALVSLTKAKIQSMERENIKSLKLIQRIKKNPQKMLTIVLLGNNLVNISATAYATVLADALFEDNAITVVTAVMTAAILIFGEILPKAIANRYSFGFSRVVVYPLFVLEVVLYPVIWLLEKAISGLLHLIGQKDIKSVTEDELKAMVSIGAEEGSLEKHEQELIQNVLDFDTTEAEDIMVPRPEIDSMSDSTTIEEAIRFMKENHHSRVPIYKGYRENIIGVLNVKDLLQALADNSDLKKTLKEIELQPVFKCPTTKKIHDLFYELQQKRQHMAFIYDEYGGLEGLVTTEDILEELVGDIMDEFDHNEETESITKLDGDSILVDGKTELEEITDFFEVNIDEYEKSDQISWIILDILNRYPNKDEMVDLGEQLQLQISNIDPVNKVIKKVIVTRKK